MDVDNNNIKMDTSNATVTSTSLSLTTVSNMTLQSASASSSSNNNSAVQKRSKRKTTAATSSDDVADSTTTSTNPSASPSAPRPSSMLLSQSEKLALHPSHLCRFWLKRKARYCTFDVHTKTSSEFCVYHGTSGKNICEFCKTPLRDDPPAVISSTGISSGGGEMANNNNNNRPKKLTALEQHLLVCPKKKSDASSALLPFYQANVNGVWRTAPASASATNEPASGDAPNVGADHDEAPPKESSLHEVPRDELWALIRTLDDIGRRVFGFDANCVENSDAQTKQRIAAETIKPTSGISSEQAASEPVDTSKSTSTSDNSGSSSSSAPISLSANSRLRHQLQHESFFHVLDSHNLLRRGSLILEVGAGKAGLAGHIALRVEKEEKEKLNHQLQSDEQQKLKKPKTTSSSDASSSVDSFSASSSQPPSFTLVVLDRGSFKHKTDTLIRQQQSITRVELKRYRIDLQDVVLERMSEVEQFIVPSASIDRDSAIPPPLSVVIGKHVCGQATDFVCKAVARANSNSMPSNAAGTSPVVRAISCVAIATCCHHLCVWDNYVNPSYIESLGLTPRQFHLMTRMSTWRTCGYNAHTQRLAQTTQSDATAMDDDSSAPTATQPASHIDKLHPTYQMSVSDRTRIGFICKHIFDTGRVQFLKEQAGFHGVAERTAFTTSDITKENFMILLA